MAVPVATEEVLRRGLETFAELGYEQTSVRELARRVGVSHNFFNDRYGSKLAFWQAVVDFAIAEAGPLVDPDDARPDDAELLVTTVRRFYHLAARHPQLQRLIWDEAARDSDRLDYLVERYIHPTLDAVTPSVERLVAAGQLPPTPMHLLYFAVTGAVAGVIQGPLARRIGRPEPSSPHELADLADVLAQRVLDGTLPLR
jgi:AcrR family transcriptional regulator